MYHMRFQMVDLCSSAGSEAVSSVTVELSRESLDTILDGLGRIRDQLSVVAGKWWLSVWTPSFTSTAVTMTCGGNISVHFELFIPRKCPVTMEVTALRSCLLSRPICKLVPWTSYKAAALVLTVSMIKLMTVYICNSRTSTSSQLICAFCAACDALSEWHLVSVSPPSQWMHFGFQWSNQLKLSQVSCPVVFYIKCMVWTEAASRCCFGHKCSLNFVSFNCTFTFDFTLPSQESRNTRQHR